MLGPRENGALASPLRSPSGEARGRRVRRKSRGQAMVEFALVLPIFALFLVIAVDFGRVFFTYIQINNAAREAAAFGASAPTNNAGMQATAAQEKNAQAQGGETTMQVGIPVCKNPAAVVIPCSTAAAGAGPGNTLTVEITERFTFITPLVNDFFNNNLIMRTSATATVLGYVASSGGSTPGSCSPPIPLFTLVVKAGLVVHADPTGSTPNSGVCNISGYNWDWGDGTSDVGAATGLDHTYLAAGTYLVTLQATNQGGATSIAKTVTVPAGPPPPTCVKPVANFTFTVDKKDRTYRDASTVADPVNCPITAWKWTFTDLGTTSNAQNPATQTYGDNSAHPVTLQVTNAAGTSTVTKNS